MKLLCNTMAHLPVQFLVGSIASVKQTKENQTMQQARVLCYPMHILKAWQQCG
jgi:hypothetical protein